jgi:UDP-hydrolysing UDP-N-acetyl-D-glucosamine 2-epimerase
VGIRLKILTQFVGKSEMRVLCVSGSRADQGGIEATHQALIKKGVDSELRNVGNIAFSRNYDLAVVLGDRFEVLHTVFDIFINKMPIAHLSGGDITEGSQDDSMRHAITKLSHLHFPTNEESAKRIIQMGEEPWRVKVVGYPGVDNPEFELKEEFQKLGSYILLVWHPNTMATEEQALIEATIIANALEVARGHRKVVVIGPNQDAGGAVIAKFLKQWAEFTGNMYIDTLPRPQYLGLLKFADCLIGNSSSGFYEAPSFGTPVLDIGDRQKGRIFSQRVFNVGLNSRDIDNTLFGILAECKRWKSSSGNPYQTGNASEKIAETIAKIKDPKKLLEKRFFTVKH